MRKTFLATALTAALAAVPATTPAAAAEHDAHHSGGSASARTSSDALSTGDVRKVDPDAKKITIRHGPLENLGMPPMTMVFQVSDPGLLGQVKTGDKIRFKAEKSGGTFVITRIEPQ
jgi:Cu(I)/Ag(I) efflux system periplasmic protein CusF